MTLQSVEYISFFLKTETNKHCTTHKTSRTTGVHAIARVIFSVCEILSKSKKKARSSNTSSTNHLARLTEINWASVESISQLNKWRKTWKTEQYVYISSYRIEREFLIWVCVLPRLSLHTVRCVTTFSLHVLCVCVVMIIENKWKMCGVMALLAELCSRTVLCSTQRYMYANVGYGAWLYVCITLECGVYANGGTATSKNEKRELRQHKASKKGAHTSTQFDFRRFKP